MSGGRLVVLDRSGRPTRPFELPSGLATLGSGAHCDICFVSSTQVAQHHASVVVHANQTIIRNVGDGETLVNGRPVSVAALEHGDTVGVGGRALRWEYYHPPSGPPAQVAAHAQPALHVRGRIRSGRARRASGPAALTRVPRDADLQLALELKSRASAPGGSRKQVAIVQPQRRDTSERDDKNSLSTAITSRTNAQRARNEQGSITQTPSDTFRRATTSRFSLRSSPSLQNMTKATLWIESRKTPRKSAKTPVQIPTPRRVAITKKRTPLRTAVLKNALTPNSSTALGRKSHSAQKTKVMKIEAPLKIDHTKQAALMLMTGHTPKSKIPIPKKGSAKQSSSYVVKKFSSVTRTSRNVNRGRRSKETGTATDIGMTPKAVSTGGRSKRPSSHLQGAMTRKSSRHSASKSITILQVTDSDGLDRSMINESDISTRSTTMNPRRSRSLPSARKSALKNPSAKKNTRKTDSIKFDLSNLESHAQDGPTLEHSNEKDSLPEEEMALRYDSDTTMTISPSQRRSIHSRSSRILEKTLGTSVTDSSTLTRLSSLSTSVPQSPSIRKSPRVSKIVQKALENSEKNDLSASESSHALPSRSPRDMETYSIVDLVSIDINEPRSPSIYDSADSSVITFGTPAPVIRKTRSTINSPLLGSSTPYHTEKSVSTSTVSEGTTRKSKAITTPEDAERPISVNSTRVSRITRSRSLIDDSTASLLFSVLDEQTEDSTPKSSNKTDRSGWTHSSVRRRATNVSMSNPALRSGGDGEITPQNRHSPVEPTTPVLSIQNLLNSSQNSLTSRSWKGKSFLDQRKTIATRVPRSGTKIAQPGLKSKSLSYSGRKILLSKNDKGAPRYEEKIVTPKATVKLVQEGVKNKHSSAKRPHSKRSIIDTLNELDIVKQLFSSPVKRKLSQSMTEFSRKHLFDDEDPIPGKRPTRNTIAVMGKSSYDNELVDRSKHYSTGVFVSPLTSPGNSPNLDGVKRLFDKNTPENDLRDVRGVKRLLRSPQPKKTSVNNDLSDVRGVRTLFARSPKNDLTQVSGVKTLFRSSRKSKPTKKYSPSVEGVKSLFNRRTPRNDLRNVSGIKRTMRITSPKNNLSDVRGVKQLYARERTDHLSDLSGIEELYNESLSRFSNSESVFDQLVGKPPIKATYSRSFTAKSSITTIFDRSVKHTNARVEDANKTDNNESNKTITSQAHVVRELQKLVTDTVQGCTPICSSRVRSYTSKSVSKEDQHSLPLKKRSVTKSFENRELERSSKRLPIKKRAVISSTPLKNNKFNWTAEVSALGRMSPIRDDKTALVADTPTRRQASKSSKAKAASVRRGVRDIYIDHPAISISNSTQRSLKRVPPSKAKTLMDMSQLKVTTTRKINQNLVSPVTNKTKGRPSLVITKKNPVLSPKPASGKRRITASKEKPKENLSNRIEPKSTRARTRLQEKATEKLVTPRVTRRKVAQKTIGSHKPSLSKNITSPEKKPTRREPRESKSNKRTKAKVDNPSVVVTKPSPRPKPRATRSQKPEIDTSEPRRTRKAIENVKDLIDEVPKKRSRKIITTTNTVESKQKESKSRRGKIVKDLVQNVITKNTKSRMNNNVTENIENAKRNTRAKKVESVNSERSEPVTRARKAQSSDDTTVTGRKRKAVIRDDPVPSKVAKTSGNVDIKKNSRTREAPQVAEMKPQGAKSKRYAVKDTTVATNTRTRRNKNAENVGARENSVKKTAAKDMKKVSEVKPARGRGRRAVPVVEEPPRETGRKRRVNADAAPTKAPVKVSKRARKNPAIASPAPPPPRVRTARSQPDPPTAAAASRRRR